MMIYQKKCGTPNFLMFNHHLSAIFQSKLQELLQPQIKYSVVKSGKSPF